MLTTPTSLLGQLNELRREMDRVFREFAPDLGLTPPATGVFPPVNVWSDGETLFVEAEVPGVKLEDLDITAVGNELTIRGRREPLTGDNLVYHRQERGTGEFTRVLTLPVEVDADRIEAVVRDGVLTIRLPKAESARPRKIAVKTG